MARLILGAPASRSKLGPTMPAKKPIKPEQPPWQIILEEIRSQNRATIEAVQASHAALERRIERLEQDTSKRDGMMEMAIRELRLDVRQLQADVSGLGVKVDALAHLEERVSALEKRLAS